MNSSDLFILGSIRLKAAGMVQDEAISELRRGNRKLSSELIMLSQKIHDIVLEAEPIEDSMSTEQEMKQSLYERSR